MNNAVFVISEFNPFTRGHAHLVKELRRSYGKVICLMSGAFVQRGTPACADKYLRAKAAVLGGADLVFELPFPFSCLAAPDFARAGVRMGVSLGAQSFGFGAEDDVELIKQAVSAASGADVQDLIKSEKRLSYPKAVAAAVSEAGADGTLLSKPNNILAAEYLRAAAEYAPEAQICCVKRSEEFASSSEVRAAMPRGWKNLVPQTTYETLSGSLADTRALDAAFIADLRLRGVRNDVYGADKGVLARICSAAEECSGVEELCEKAVSATLTKARVRRTLVCSYFGVTPGFARKAPSYALLLAANARGREYLAENKKDFGIPVITKPADYKAAGEKAVCDFEFALGAERVYALTAAGYAPLKATPFFV